MLINYALYTYTLCKPDIYQIMPRNLHNKHIHANNNTHNHDNIRSRVDCHSYQTSGQKPLKAFQFIWGEYREWI
jgi:hypothetical protein